jgi:hypothetical protein
MRIRLRREGQRRDLESVVMALNGENLRLSAEDRAALVRYVEAWNKAERNPWKMKLLPADAKRFSLQNLEKVWTWKLAPVGTTPETDQVADKLAADGVKIRDEVGGADWLISPIGKNFRDTAAMFAGMLLTNPWRGKLSEGPCQRERCKRWFIKRRPSQKQCSARCLGIVRSIARTKTQRKKAHQEALARARKASEAWKRNTGVAWKEFISRKTGLTIKWLTRVANKGALCPPMRDVSTNGSHQTRTNFPLPSPIDKSFHKNKEAEEEHENETKNKIVDIFHVPIAEKATCRNLAIPLLHFVFIWPRDWVPRVASMVMRLHRLLISFPRL